MFKHQMASKNSTVKKRSIFSAEEAADILTNNEFDETFLNDIALKLGRPSNTNVPITSTPISVTRNEIYSPGGNKENSMSLPLKKNKKN